MSNYNTKIDFICQSFMNALGSISPTFLIVFPCEVGQIVSLPKNIELLDKFTKLYSKEISI